MGLFESLTRSRRMPATEVLHSRANVARFTLAGSVEAKASGATHWLSRLSSLGRREEALSPGKRLEQSWEMETNKALLRVLPEVFSGKEYSVGTLTIGNGLTVAVRREVDGQPHFLAIGPARFGKSTHRLYEWSAYLYRGLPGEANSETTYLLPLGRPMGLSELPPTDPRVWDAFEKHVRQVPGKYGERLWTSRTQLV
jgi:hypothetical protein